ncbi:hypothetical protein LTS15_008062 [Exophiala xenobiotica]|nr:hypothetical protein LTS15_008062 [Exophiala xenobiotica]
MSLTYFDPSEDPLGLKWPNTQIACKELLKADSESKVRSIAPRNPHPPEPPLSFSMSEQPRPRAVCRQYSDNDKHAGLYAPIDFEPGELIFSEYAAVVCDSDGLGRRPWKDRYSMSRPQWYEYLDHVVRIAQGTIPLIRGFIQKGTIAGLEYPEDAEDWLRREAYPSHMSVYDFYDFLGKPRGETTWRDQEQFRYVARIFEDAERVQDGRERFVYVLGLLNGTMNHACHPNTIARIDAKQPAGIEVPAVTWHVYAVAPIKRGQEITKTYNVIEGPVDEYLDSLQYMYGFRCRCDTCLISEEDRTFRILRDDVYNLKMEWEALSDTGHPRSQMYRMAAVLLDGYSLLDICNQPVGDLYTTLVEMACKSSDAIRAFYFAIRMKLWFSERHGRPEANLSTNLLVGIQKNKVIPGESREGHSVFEDFDFYDEGLFEMMFMMNHSPDDEVYHCLQVVNGSVEEVSVEVSKKRLETKLESEQQRAQLWEKSIDELAKELEEEPPSTSKKNKKSKKKRKATNTTKEEDTPLAEDADTTKERQESLSQPDEAITTPVLEEQPVVPEVRSLDDTKEFPEHEGFEILIQAPSMVDKVHDAGYETGAADTNVNQSSLAAQRDSDHLNKPEVGHPNVSSVNGRDTSSSRSVEDLSPSQQLGAFDFLSQSADVGSTSTDGPVAIRTRNGSRVEKNTNHSSAVSSRFSPRESKGPHTIPQPLVAPTPVRSPSAFLNGDFTTPRPQKRSFKKTNPLYNRPERTTSRSEADEASWTIKMPRRRQNQAGSRAPAPARREVQKHREVKKPHIAPATKTARDYETQTEAVYVQTPRERQADLDREQYIAELESRNRYLEAVVGLVVEEDVLDTEPFVCPFGAEDGTSKSAWLACAASREDLRHNSRDVGHLLAAKDGIGARLEGFVLCARRDSVCGRVEGWKEVFVVGGRLRAHSFGNDASRMDFLKQAEVRESEEV